jgi:predicted nuclease with TOPRIM domain
MMEGQNSAVEAQAADQLGMAAVGRQFTELAVKNEQLRADLQKVVAIANEQAQRIAELEAKVQAQREDLTDLRGEAAEEEKKES